MKSSLQPHIRIWNSVSLHTQAVIGMNDFDLSVCCLSFSKADGGALLVAIDEAPDHNISVWEWQKGEHGYKITETKVTSNHTQSKVLKLQNWTVSKRNMVPMFRAPS